LKHTFAAVQKNHKPSNIKNMILLDESPGCFLAFFAILILKEDLTVYTLFIIRGGKNMRNSIDDAS